MLEGGAVALVVCLLDLRDKFENAFAGSLGRRCESGSRRDGQRGGQPQGTPTHAAHVVWYLPRSFQWLQTNSRRFTCRMSFLLSKLNLRAARWLYR